ncbi:LytTR family transcriptional regulator DNA-binding domain-containing protein [Granulosicoccus sp.]|nr:LytTR family DNA-binding domain-containing protein [Granulosicoccus sp.]MDB4223882.1 LytTR family transcriptional regulator DNA-binding domain-containing protein [Granulosicoccus sp.]
MADDELRVRLTLNELDSLLPPEIFVRVHRLVNMQLAREIIAWDSHSMTLVMGDTDRTEIPVSRSNVHQLKQIAGW